ncbi:MAG TPA: hypothetical protein VIO61_00515 [Anaerolineaceae bacterium]
MSESASSQKDSSTGCGCLFLILLLIAAGYSGVRYWIDSTAYKTAHAAYLQADCKTAVEQYQKVVDAFRLIDFGSLKANSKRELADCNALQSAADQEAANPEAAIVAYDNFVVQRRGQEHPLVPTAQKRSQALYRADPAKLATANLCGRVDALAKDGLLPEEQSWMPTYQFACAETHRKAGDDAKAYPIYLKVLADFPASPEAALAASALKLNQAACTNAAALKKNPAVSSLPGFLPGLYLACATTQDAKKQYSLAMPFYLNLLAEYPNSAEADSALKAVLASPLACQNLSALREILPAASKASWMPDLYRSCAQSAEKEGDYNGAVTLYDAFLADYPAHPAAAQVKEALAKAIIAGAKRSGASTLPDPTRSGAASSGTSVIVVRNDAPVRLRIAISGPETRIEEMDACATCQKYTGIGPLTCPNKGPVARYTVKPGEYAVVVQSISDGKVTPFSGTWKLTSGQEYSSCFYIVTRTLP